MTDPYQGADGRDVPSLFTDVCFDITALGPFNRLIAEGYLSPLLPRRPRALLSADGLHMRAGEFIQSELQGAPDLRDISETAMRETMQVAAEEGRTSWLMFAAGVDHAEELGEILEGLGVAVGVVHSKRADRDKTIAAFKHGDLTCVVNNNVLTTGFDHPGIDLITCLRMTASAVLWVQMMGRGTRPVYGPDGRGTGFDLDDVGGRLAAIAAGPKQNCRVLDYAGNSRRLGPINDPVVPRRKGQGGGDAPVKVCDRCGGENHASVRVCVECGTEFSFEVKLKLEASTQELIAGDSPLVEVFKVDQIIYSPHSKPGKPPMLKVSYYCGLRSVFSDFVMPEHEGWGRRKSAGLWRDAGGGELPRTAAEALERADVVLRPVTHLRVWTNDKPYPTILQRCYDGTAFGTEERGEPPEVSRYAPARRSAPAFSNLDDEVPF